jgi:hypothetical protein
MVAQKKLVTLVAIVVLFLFVLALSLQNTLIKSQLRKAERKTSATTSSIQNAECVLVEYSVMGEVSYRKCTKGFPAYRLEKDPFGNSRLYCEYSHACLLTTLDHPIYANDFSDLRILHLSLDSRYLVASGTVYYNENAIIDADPSSFVVVGKGEFLDGPDAVDQPILYAKDNTHAYFDGAVIPHADPPTFIFIPTGAYEQEYAKDIAHVYYHGDVIWGADPLTFKSFARQAYEGAGAGPYAVDAVHVFYGVARILEADLETFEVLSGNYAKDKSHIFLNGEIIVGAKPETFEFPKDINMYE